MVLDFCRYKVVVPGMAFVPVHPGARYPAPMWIKTTKATTGNVIETYATNLSTGELKTFHDDQLVALRHDK